MHVPPLLQDLAVILLVAGIVTTLFHKLRQPVVLGYILAGVIIGPHTPPMAMISNEHGTIQTLAELGVIMLMFSLGLHFSLRQLFRVGPVALTAALLEIVLMVVIGYEIGRWFGWATMDSLFLGAILSISSTTIIVKALEELGMGREKWAGMVFGILVVEDILAIAMLVLLSGIAMSGTLRGGEVMMTLGKLGVFLTVVLVMGLLLLPPLLRFVSRFKNNEVMLVTVLGICFGLSLLASKMGYSVALGAFIAGAIMAESRERARVERLVEPVRDIFSAVFFVAIGLMIDPRMLVEFALPIAVVTVVVIVGKVLACGAGVFVVGAGPRTSLKVGMSLAQIGEFSFIIAQLGHDLKVTSEFLYPIAVMVSATTTLTTPYLIRSSDPLTAWFDRHAPTKVTGALEVYTAWVARLKQRRAGAANPVVRLLTRWWLQIALNVALLTGLMVAAAAFGRRAMQWMPRFVENWSGGPFGVVWGLALLASLPLVIAIFRKLRAAAALMAEAGIHIRGDREATQRVRRMFANSVVAAGCVLLGAWVLILTATILPPLPGLLLLLGVAALTALFLWRAMIRLYAKAQVALVETLADASHEDHGHEPAPTPLPAELVGARLERHVMSPASPHCGRSIAELTLRTRTGASVVAIQRSGANIINPDPHETLRASDTLLLLGVEPSIDAARAILDGHDPQAPRGAEASAPRR